MLLERPDVWAKTPFIQNNIQRISTTSSKDINDKQLQIGKHEKILKIKTKAGNLIVRTTVSDGGKKVENIVIEKEKTETPKIQEPPILVAAPAVDVKPQLTEKEMLAEKNKELVKRRKRVDIGMSSTERNYITPNRAMQEFLLTPSDLEGLFFTKRRSPYEEEPPITVYRRKDVQEKAIEIWGSRENLINECLKRERDRQQHQQNVFTMKRRLRDYRREVGARTHVILRERENQGLKGSSGKVVLTAVSINAVNFLFKCFAWVQTGKAFK